MTKLQANIQERIQREARESAALIEKFNADQAPTIAEILEEWVECLDRSGQILFAGNGGSAADCQHLACELIGGFPRKGDVLAATALTTNSSILTAVSNDFGFEYVFSRQVEALARPGDILVVMTTSGNSSNLIHAVAAARKIPISVLGFLGGDGGALAAKVDLGLIVPSDRSDRVQECHTVIGHILCRLAQERLSANKPQLRAI